ncbi:hypothetical protein [Bradyrhizobium sp. CCBAU 45384]|uniref:hypothetical protein n=1 Tax=Bradyrhizobium sp. CCBAU 45384 TaxID=858428 RepID=UPI002306CCEF|nr:hypothetical protein [Bradyrhizobium sp. CCBAU 45384]MDA9408030.1 hypothetical protein [Bradyrhizobium sp. CCBAU 45384]
MSSVDDFESEFEPEPESMTTGKGVIQTRADFSRWTGQSQTTVDHWLRDGMPVVQKATKRQPYKINSADAFAWLRSKWRGGEDVNAAKLDAVKVATRLKRLALAEREGLLVPVDAVIQEATEQLAAFKRAVLNIHTQVHGLSPEQREQLQLAQNDALGTMRGIWRRASRRRAVSPLTTTKRILDMSNKTKKTPPISKMSEASRKQLDAAVCHALRRPTEAEFEEARKRSQDHRSAAVGD